MRKQQGGEPYADDVGVVPRPFVSIRSIFRILSARFSLHFQIFFHD